MWYLHWISITKEKLSPNIFITNANKIIEFILNALLPYDLNENDGIYKENKYYSK